MSTACTFRRPPALIATLIVVMIVGVLIEFVVFRPLRDSAPLAKLAASLGLLLVAQAAVSLAFGIETSPASRAPARSSERSTSRRS